MDELNKMYNINFKQDSPEVHPSHLCLKCYAQIGNFNRAGCIPSTLPVLWESHNERCCKSCELAAKRLQGGRKKKKRTAGRPKSSSLTVDDMTKLYCTKPIPPSVEKAISHVISLKVKHSQLPNNSIQINTGGPQPLTLTTIALPRKETQDVTKRRVRSRTKQSKELLEMISGNSTQTTATQASHLVQSFDECSRQQILNSFKSTVTIPPDHVAAMKSTLNLPWNLLRDVRRWLQTFKVNLASESKSRIVFKEWVGDALRSEEVPALIIKGKNSSIELRP